MHSPMVRHAFLSELRSCVKVEVYVRAPPFIIVRTVSVDVKQYIELELERLCNSTQNEQDETALSSVSFESKLLFKRYGMPTFSNHTIIYY